MNNKEGLITIVKRVNERNTVKYLFKLLDGNYIETVSISRRGGTTLCISTQVGCAVKCVFCESGKYGLIRNLSTMEIIAQYRMVKEKTNRIVFMGMGEPLHNYKNLIEAIHILRDRGGINFPTEGITISTVAPLRQMRLLREEHIKVQLTVSLHATTQKTRNYLIPNMSIYPLAEVVKSIVSYSERHSRTVVVAYMPLCGINDSVADAMRLVRWFTGKRIRINLLPYNFTGAEIVAPTKCRLAGFKRMLEEGGMEVTIRESMGESIYAACGQLSGGFRTRYKN